MNQPQIIVSSEPGFAFAVEPGSLFMEANMKCPNCKSKNTIKTRAGNMKVGRKIAAGVVFAPLAFAVGKRTKVGECFECGNRWKI